MRPLPYPEHTWSFTQHAVGLNAKTLYGLLKCAAPFEGLAKGYGRKITQLMVEENILTQNIRDGKADAWRDYQQILAELGLIYSTKTSKELLLTEAGHMFLAGEVGFSELMGAQALRYQYPNGQKFILQKRMRTALAKENIQAPETLIEVQVAAGLLLKPGTLILRIIYELAMAGEVAALSLSECQAFLLPCRNSAEWPIALSEILLWRKSRPDISQVNRHARRNIGDWFKFLAKTDFFKANSSESLALSAYAKENTELVRKLCEEQEDPSSFWIPTDGEIEQRQRWFDWFGHISYQSQRVLRMQGISEEYVKHNYIGGLEEEDSEDASITPIQQSAIALSPIDLSRLTRDRSFSYVDNEDLNALAEKLRRGAQKRHAKTILHDRIVKELAKQFQAQGAIVEEDPDSIDLFAKWPNGAEAIFEVKTVTRRSLQDRVRKAIGQVEEYAYRRKLMTNNLADRIIVVNTELEKFAWQTGFIVDYLGLGLICKPTLSYNAYAPADAASKNYWLTTKNSA